MLSLLLPAVAGIVCHLAYFIRGEHLVDVPPILASAFTAQCAYLTLACFILGWDMTSAVVFIIRASAGFLSGLWTSMAVYRLFFHPLRGWPGPVSLRLSNFCYVLQTRKLDQYRNLEALHRQYGDYVRIGPNRVSVIDPDVVLQVHGPASKCQKGSMYDASLPLTTLHQIRDKASHDRRRRGGWDRAFSIKALRSYEGRLLDYSTQLEVELKTQAGRPVDAAQWFKWLSFDLMAELTFGYPFGGLRTQQTHWAIDAIQESNAVCALLGAVPWVIHLLTKLPPFMNPMYKLLRFSEESVERRRQKRIQEPDIMTHLLAADQFFEDSQREHQLLTGDARLLIIAGSDTTSAALTFLFYHIAQNPSIAEKVRTELAANGIDNESLTVQSVHILPYLTAIIDETLRLHPPVPTQPVRQAQPEGLQIGDWFIPGDTEILTPAWCIQRCKHLPHPILLS